MAFRAKNRNSLAVIAAAALAACASAPPPPAWQLDASGALGAFEQAYLKGDSVGAEAEFQRARSALTATGRAELVARAELVRCAARVASLDFSPCSGFEALRADAGDAERAYAEYLEGKRARTPGAEPFSRLVALGVEMRTARISPQGMAEAVEIASAQGWRRPLLAWLGVQLKRAEQAGDGETAARLRRRIELVSG